MTPNQKWTLFHVLGEGGSAEFGTGWSPVLTSLRRLGLIEWGSGEIARITAKGRIEAALIAVEPIKPNIREMMQ